MSLKLSYDIVYIAKSLKNCCFYIVSHVLVFFKVIVHGYMVMSNSLVMLQGLKVCVGGLLSYCKLSFVFHVLD